MNEYIDNQIVLNKKITPLVYVYIMIIIIISFSLIIIFMLFHYKTYYIIKGTVINEEDNYYIKCYIPISDIKYITSSDNLLVDKKVYKYNIKRINEEYYTDNSNTYQEVILDIELQSNYKYNNLVLDLKLLKENKRVIDLFIGGKI